MFFCPVVALLSAFWSVSLLLEAVLALVDLLAAVADSQPLQPHESLASSPRFATGGVRFLVLEVPLLGLVVVLRGGDGLQPGLTDRRRRCQSRGSRRDRGVHVDLLRVRFARGVLLGLLLFEACWSCSTCWPLPGSHPHEPCSPAPLPVALACWLCRCTWAVSLLFCEAATVSASV